jgi:two-component system, OmpR family, sensor kinase
VTSDRLTRNELTWLLAQEARNASQKLRQGVTIVQAGEAAPPAPVIEEEGTGGMERTLNQLDEAVGMLASLHGHPMPRGRRGKVDVAALLWEIAPEARVQIAMGDGTSVFGDEAELRRMLHVLLAQSGNASSSGATPDIFVRREKDEVRVGVNLGPDPSPSFDTERAWLSRMAIRYGGRLELDGSMQTLTLLADVDIQRQELENLRKELAAAQAQGEAYARELAAMFAQTDVPSSTPEPAFRMPVSTSLDPATRESLSVLVAAVRVVGADLRGILSAVGRDITPLRDREGEAGEIAASVSRHITAASEVIADLTRLGSCPIGELPRHFDGVDLLLDVVREDSGKAARQDVRVKVEGLESGFMVVPQATFTVLLHMLLDHAISSSPTGREVIITVTRSQGGHTEFRFDDAGTPLPTAARKGVLSRDFEALALGRRISISLIAAYAIAAHLKMPIEIEDGKRGGASVKLTVPSQE